MAEENAIGGLAVLFLMILVALAIWRTVQGGDPSNSFLVWFGNHPDLFAGIIVLLVIVGAIFNIASRL
ncbi:hypothetical protein [Halorarum halobium]|uniref:hypothetical protein n=1 Tax=Halorarum halobium TaxID=3075121 RepID=UPI0028A7563E|nr:hypothetical protein [Halobaculum sp. XH14]